VDSTLLAVLHPRQLEQSAGFDGAAGAVWGSFAVYGVKLHLLSPTNRVPLSYELTSANVADVLLVRELLTGADLDEDGVVGRLFGNLAYRSGTLGEELTEAGALLATERADRRPAIRQHVEVCFAALKRVFGMGETLAATLAGLVTGIAAKVCAYTYGLYVTRLLGRPQGRIKELQPALAEDFLLQAPRDPLVHFSGHIRAPSRSAFSTNHAIPNTRMVPSPTAWRILILPGNPVSLSERVEPRRPRPPFRLSRLLKPVGALYRCSRWTPSMGRHAANSIDEPLGRSLLLTDC
jgi:hypothetical protein